MARFGLIDSDDEDIPVQSSKTAENAQGELPPVPSQSKGKGRAVSPPMEVDELLLDVSRQKKPRANVLVEDEREEHLFTHKARSRAGERVGSSEEEGTHGEEDGDDQGLDPPSRADAVPWPARIGLEPHKLHVMQTSLFRMPEEQAAFDTSRQKGGTTFGKLKPKQHAEKLLKASERLARKHSRGSDSFADGMRLEKSERASFDNTLDPEPYRPAKKVLRVQPSQSVSSGNEGLYADAGLAFGRSFRNSWGPGGQITRIGGFSSSVVYIEQISMISYDKQENSEESRHQLLDVQIDHTKVEVDEHSIPLAYPLPSLTFASFATTFSESDNSPQAQLWREGVALFDALQQPTSDYVTPVLKHQIVAIQRRKALAEWLAATVAPIVTSSLLEDVSGSSAQNIFLRLTGHQIDEAVNAAAADGNVYLSMALSQAGGDNDFRTDLDAQLNVWAAEGSDKFIGEAYRKCLAVLSGVADIWRPSNANLNASINVVKGLDWKRAFGLALWYGPGSDGVDNYESALQHFQHIMGKNNVPLPLPWYTDNSSNSDGSASSEEYDALYEFLRLATAQIPLERAIYPKAFGRNTLDYRMTWHTYTLLSRSMRMKDFSDRQPIDEREGSTAEGHSETADMVTSAYAAQLESLGEVQKAAFVLLHLESSEGRTMAIKELLSRQAHSLVDWQVVGLQSLSIPLTWIEEARACLAQYEGRMFDAYEHFLRAGQQRLAHDIAVTDLAPDAVIREDLDLLRALFRPFKPQAVDDWSFRGKLFLDYVEAMERIPGLVASVQDNAVPDTTVASELEKLRNLIPQLVRALPDIFRDRSDPRHNAALSVMLSGLLSRFDSIKTKSGVQPDFDPDLVDEATRLQHIHFTSYNRFTQTVSALA